MPLGWLFGLYGQTLSSYPYATLNAFNLFALTGGNWVDQQKILLFMPYQAWGYVAIAAALALSLYVVYRKRALSLDRSAYLAAALLLIVAMFVLGVRMHERYMFPALLLLLAVYAYTKERRILQLFFGFGVTHYINVAYVLEASIQKQTAIDRLNGIMMISSLVNVLLLVYLIRVCTDMYQNRRRLQVEPLLLERSGEGYATITGEPAPFDSDTEFAGRMTRKDGLWMALLTIVYAVVAFVNLGSATAPQTSWKPDLSGETIYVDFGGAKAVDRINLYTGIGDGKLKIEFSDSMKPWAGASPQTVDINYVKTFAWTSLAINQQARYAKITVESPGLILYELAFFEKDADKAIPVRLQRPEEGETAPKLTVERAFDEQEKVKYRPSYLDGTYFDEIYHARTAYEHLHGLPTYENTHPPLGKLLIAVGIWMFGMDPFGWRIVGTAVGIAMIPLLYLFAKRMFRSTEYALIAAGLFTLDFMHFAQTRIATIDVYGVFFIMLMYYFMYRYTRLNFYRLPFKKTLVPLFWCGLFFGIGAASKWIVIYGGAGLAFLLFLSLYDRYREYEAAKGALSSGSEVKERDAEVFRSIIRLFPRRTLATVAWCVPFFVIIPAAIYAASFIPWLTADGGHYTLKGLIDANKSMYDYHSNLKATHSFGSPWYEWPIMVKPIWYFGGQALLPAGQISSIVSMGNPAIWWAGMAAIVATIWLAARRRDKGMLVVLVAYFSQYVPWMLVTRLTFIYHYFAMVPFMVLCITYCLKALREYKPALKKAVYAYIGVAFVLFVLFYPILSGMIVSKSYVMYVLRWFPSWFFYS